MYMSCIKYYENEQVRLDETRRTCSTHGRTEPIQRFGKGNIKERITNKTELDGKAILKWILKRYINYIYLAQYRDLWGALVKTVIYLMGIQNIRKVLSGF
jgi:hypothetical protein